MAATAVTASPFQSFQEELAGGGLADHKASASAQAFCKLKQVMAIAEIQSQCGGYKIQ